MWAADYRYLCFGFEKGKNNTPHIQGYIYYDNPRMLTGVKQDLPRAHLEVSKGSLVQNVAYCSKDGDFYEDGERPHQGKASFEAIEEAMHDPTVNFQLYNQYRRSYREYTLSRQRPNNPRLLRLIPSDHLLAVCKTFSPGEVCFNVDTYEGEICLMIELSSDRPDFDIVRWKEGFPMKVRRGYEVITIDPEIVYVCWHGTVDRHELIQKYCSYIDDADCPQ